MNYRALALILCLNTSFLSADPVSQETIIQAVKEQFGIELKSPEDVAGFKQFVKYSLGKLINQAQTQAMTNTIESDAWRDTSELGDIMDIRPDWSYRDTAALATSAGLIAPAFYTMFQHRRLPTLGWAGWHAGGALGVASGAALNLYVNKKKDDIIRAFTNKTISKEEAAKQLKKLRILAIANGVLLGAGFSSVMATGGALLNRTTDFAFDGRKRSYSTKEMMEKAHKQSTDNQQPLFCHDCGRTHQFNKEEAAKIVAKKGADGHRVWFDKPVRATWSKVSFKDWLTQADPKRSFTIQELDAATNEPVGDPAVSQQASLYKPFKREAHAASKA